jgi:hypothetical protein
MIEKAMGGSPIPSHRFFFKKTALEATDFIFIMTEFFIKKNKKGKLGPTPWRIRKNGSSLGADRNYKGRGEGKSRDAEWL